MRKYWIILGVMLAIFAAGFASAASNVRSNGMFEQSATATASITVTQYQWFDLHGVNAEIENLGNCAAVYKYGWGTEFYLKPGTATWVHYAIPTPYYGNLTQTWVQTYLPTSGRITQIDVWDGGTKRILSYPYPTPITGAGTWITFSRSLPITTRISTGGVAYSVRYYNPTANTLKFIAGDAGGYFKY